MPLDPPGNSAPSPDDTSRPRRPGQAFALERFRWEDVAPRLREELGRPHLDEATLGDWSLVLWSRRIPHRAERLGAGRLFVPPLLQDAAVAEIRRYEEENRSRARTEPPPAPMSGAVQAVAWTMLALAVFHVARQFPWPTPGLAPDDWTTMGGNDSLQVLVGQKWRLVTALTLHADMAHLLGNVVIGGMFLIILCRELGPGLGLALALGAGILGNGLSDWVHGPGRMSLGASTSVFGAVGVLGGLRALRGQGMELRKAFLPVAAGLAILGMLGTEGERTDLAAHLFGFLAGLPMGCAVGLRINRRGLPRPRTTAALGALAAAVVLGSWGAALAWWF